MGKHQRLWRKFGVLAGPLVILLLLLLWLGPFHSNSKKTQSDSPTATQTAATDAVQQNEVDASARTILSQPPAGPPRLHEAFARTGVPTPTRPFPRGANGERRYAAPTFAELPEAVREHPPLPMAMSPADGRVALLPEETDLHTKSARRMVLDVGALESVAAGEASRLLAPMPDGTALILNIHSVKSRAGMTHTLQGEVEGEPQTSVVQLVLHDGIVHGSVARYDIDQHIEYRILPSGHLMVRELDASTMTAECGDPGNAPDDPGDGYPDEDEPGVPDADTLGYTTVDVVVGYDKGARAMDGGYTQIEARIIASVDRMTQSFQNSLITGTELMLLGTIEDPDYVFPGQTSGTMGSADELRDLEITTSDNPRLNTVSDYANALGADLKAFILQGTDGSAGVAWRPGTSSITARTYMTSLRITFAHELGHNFGARHSWGDTAGTDGASNVHAYGWRLVPPGHARVRTIMAYDWNWGSSSGVLGARIPYFANPEVLYQGVRTGQVNGYNASGDPYSDPRYVSGGLIGSLGAGFNGTNPNLGARNAHYIHTQASGRASQRMRTAFQVVTPTTSSVLENEDQTEIHWTGGDHRDSVVIDLYKGGTFHSQIVAGLGGEERHFLWTIPTAIAAGPDYMVRVIRNGSLVADSGLFTIQGSSSLTLMPSGGFEASGNQGGPFTPAAALYTLGNDSGAPLHWTASVDRPWVALSLASGTLAIGADVDVMVSLTTAANALSFGIHEAMVTFTETGNGTSLQRIVRLEVIGSPNPRIIIEQPPGNPLSNGLSSVSFGETAVGSPPATRSFTLRNGGDVALTLSSVGLQGTDAAHFQVGAPSATLLAPGQTATLLVSFTPQTVGVKTAELRIGSNDPDDNPYFITLQGTGFLSNNANLSGLVLSGGALSPAFASATTNYTVSVPFATTSTMVTPTRAQAGASIALRVNGGSYLPVVSGRASGTLGLNVGGNLLEVRVTAQDGTTQKTYTVAVNRGKAAQNIVFGHPGHQVATNTVNLSATGGGSGNPVIFTASGPATISGGNQISFTGPGSVTVRANQAGDDYYQSAPEVVRTISVVAADASVTLSNLIHTYDGIPKAATATTDPPGLPLSLVHNPATPTAAGSSYSVTATITDPLYSGKATRTLVIHPAAQTIVFSNPGDQLATATVHLSASGGESGENVVFIAEGPAQIDGGNVLSFTGPGSVTVRANQAGNANYHPAPELAHTFTVTAATATVILSRLHQVADGSAREVLATTDPPDLEVEITYDGGTDAPTVSGSYAVTAAIADPRYEGSADDTLVVDDPARMETVPGGTLPALSALGELAVPTFQIGAYEVTGSQWAAVVVWAEAHAGYDFDGIGSAASGDRPVTGVNWSDAAKWCNARTEWENATLGQSLLPVYRVGGAVFKTGNPTSPAELVCDFEASGYRLPTAAEWEFAARGGSSGVPSLYPGGSDLDGLGWHSSNSDGGVQPAGGKAPNGLILYDLAGNVAEWTWDAPSGDPAQRLLRGGSWQDDASACELSVLNDEDPALRAGFVGFRLVQVISLSAALDHDNLVWESAGDQAWFAQTGTTHDGEDAAESGSLSLGQESWLETIVEGPGNLSFRWKTVGSEGVDILNLAVGGIEVQTRSGAGDWEESIVEIGEGTQLLRWTYLRGSESGEARAWLDGVEYNATFEPTVTTAPAGDITGTGTVLGGEVTNDGGREVTARGVVYATTSDPAPGSAIDLPATAGGTGVFTVATDELAEGTTYFVRAYATNNLGTSYGPTVSFTTNSVANFIDGEVTFEREILPGGLHRFEFTFDGSRFVSFSIVGDDSLQADLRNSQGEIIARWQGDASIAFVQLLPTDGYVLEIYPEPDEEETQSYRLTFDAGTAAVTRPDVAVGASLSRLAGRNVHLPARQLAKLISKKARPVTAYAAVGNLGNLPDVLLATAGRGNSFFKVTYHAPTGNATASLLTGSYRTPLVANGTGNVSIRIAVKPNKKKLTKKRKGKRPSLLRKKLILPISAYSTVRPSAGDAASVQVQIK